MNDLDLANEDDQLHVYDGSLPTDRLLMALENKTAPLVIMSTTNEMLVQFTPGRNRTNATIFNVSYKKGQD